MVQWFLWFELSGIKLDQRIKSKIVVQLQDLILQQKHETPHFLYQIRVKKRVYLAMLGNG